MTEPLINERGYPQHSVCPMGDPMWLISEGYAYCTEERDQMLHLYKLTVPVYNSPRKWHPFTLNGDTLYIYLKGWSYHQFDKLLDAVEHDINLERNAGSILMESKPYSEWLAEVQ